MVCSTSRADNRTEAAREQAEVETDSREGKRATLGNSSTKSLQSEVTQARSVIHFQSVHLQP